MRRTHSRRRRLLKKSDTSRHNRNYYVITLKG